MTLEQSVLRHCEDSLALCNRLIDSLSGPEPGLGDAVPEIVQDLIRQRAKWRTAIEALK